MIYFYYFDEYILLFSSHYFVISNTAAPNFSHFFIIYFLLCFGAQFLFKNAWRISITAYYRRQPRRFIILQRRQASNSRHLAAVGIIDEYELR